MEKRMIEEARCGFAGTQFGGCGPIDGPVVGEVKIVSGGETKFYSLAEVLGIPNCFITPYSTYEQQMSMDTPDEFFEELNKKYFVDCFGDDYGDIICATEDENYLIWRYLVYIVRAEQVECDEFMKKTTGKYIEDIEIPMSDIEEEWLEEMEEEDEDEE